MSVHFDLSQALSEIDNFLGCKTPAAWLEQAVVNLDVLMIDHAHCEKKAASTAMSLMYRYPDRSELLFKLSQLAREELLHFEQVLSLMQQKNVVYDHLTPSRYAKGMRQLIRTYEPASLVDTLIVGAFIEARSCERFAALSEFSGFDVDLQKYYRTLLKSEARHYEDYLALAKLYADKDDNIVERIAIFKAQEAALICEPDEQFRFHSGLPCK